MTKTIDLISIPMWSPQYQNAKTIKEPCLRSRCNIYIELPSYAVRTKQVLSRGYYVQGQIIPTYHKSIVTK